MNQFEQRSSLGMTDSSRQFHSILVTIGWNRDVLPCRRFVSGAFSRCRWFFRLSTGDCSPSQGYGGFTSVFDPGITENSRKRVVLIRGEAVQKETGTLLTGFRLKGFDYDSILRHRCEIQVVFNKAWKDKEESVMMLAIYDCLIVVATKKACAIESGGNESQNISE